MQNLEVCPSVLKIGLRMLDQPIELFSSITQTSPRRELDSHQRIEPLLKWPGGKSGELDLILPALPPRIDRFFEPFLGGGAVFFAMNPEVPAFINDASPDLAAFYRAIFSNDLEFFKCLEDISRSWLAIEEFVSCHRKVLLGFYYNYSESGSPNFELDASVDEMVKSHAEKLMNFFRPPLNHDLSSFAKGVGRSLKNKMRRMRTIEEVRGRLPIEDSAKNIEGAFKAAYYTHIRHLYNKSISLDLGQGASAALFFFLREYAYASMFRFNRKGEFNVPYGGISYNRKNMVAKIRRLRSVDVQKHLQKATFESLDFVKFLQRHPPQKDDFIFLDPPYDSDFSEYDRMVFTKEDQERLAGWLTRFCKARFMLIIKSTEFIMSLYANKGFLIRPFSKKYMWTIKERNDRNVTHLMITNY